MEEIFKQYGTPIIIVTVIVALIAIFGLLLASNNGPIMQQFSNLIKTFFEEAKFTGGGSAPASTILGGFIL